MTPAGAGPEGTDDEPFAAINVTPFVDVMLVLLVIFMVGAPLMVRGVRIDLPKAAAPALDRPRKPLVVSLARDGTLTLRTETVRLADLPSRLKTLHDQEGDATVYVRADRGVAYGEVVDILSRFGQSGFSRVSLLAEAPGQTAR